jgi:hypothetical protein
MKAKVQRTVISSVLALMLIAVSVTVAGASPPLGLHIEVDEFIGTSGETFYASGVAVDDGAVCPTGTVDDVSTLVSGAPGGSVSILHILKRFYCADSSGTFDVRLVVKLDNDTHYTTASWKMISGTGLYTGLKGNGSLAGTPIDPGVSIHDVYDGQVH